MVRYFIAKGEVEVAVHDGEAADAGAKLLRLERQQRAARARRARRPRQRRPQRPRARVHGLAGMHRLRDSSTRAPPRPTGIAVRDQLTAPSSNRVNLSGLGAE